MVKERFKIPTQSEEWEKNRREHAERKNLYEDLAKDIDPDILEEVASALKCWMDNRNDLNAKKTYEDLAKDIDERALEHLGYAVKEELDEERNSQTVPYHEMNKEQQKAYREKRHRESMGEETEEEIQYEKEKEQKIPELREAYELYLMNPDSEIARQNFNRSTDGLDYITITRETDAIKREFSKSQEGIETERDKLDAEKEEILHEFNLVNFKTAYELYINKPEHEGTKQAYEELKQLIPEDEIKTIEDKALFKKMNQLYQKFANNPEAEDAEEARKAYEELKQLIPEGVDITEVEKDLERINEANFNTMKSLYKFHFINPKNERMKNEYEEFKQKNPDIPTEEIEREVIQKIAKSDDPDATHSRGSDLYDARQRALEIIDQAQREENENV